MAVVELLVSGLEGRKALPAVSGGPVLQLLPPSHADGPSLASPGEVVVGQLEKVVQHGADGVVLVAVPLVVREPQPQLLGWHVAAAPDSDVAGRSRDGLARRLLLRYVDRRGGRAPELAGRPPGWQPALADAGVDFSGLPTDRPVGFDDIEAFELRNAGRVEVFVFVWQQTLWTDGLEYYHVPQQRATPCCFSCTAATTA